MNLEAFRGLLRTAYRLEKQGSGRGVTVIKPDIVLQTGEIASVRFEGHGWTKTVKGEEGACLGFLSGEGGVDQPEDRRAFNDIVEALLREFGAIALEAGEEFGTREVTFSVPMEVIRKAMKESAP